MNWRALAKELTVPLRGSGEAARDVAAGTGILAGRWRAWVEKSAGRDEALGKVGWSLVGVAATGVAAVHTPELVEAAAAGGLGWAYWEGYRRPGRPVPAPPKAAAEPEEQPEDEPGEQPDTADDTPAEPETPRDLRQYVEERVAAAHQAGLPGVHVADMLAERQATGYAPADWKPADLAAQLRAAGIPLRDVNIRSNGRQSNRLGCRYDDLTQALGHAPRLPPHLVPDLTPAQEPSPAGDRTPARTG